MAKKSAQPELRGIDWAGMAPGEHPLGVDWHKTLEQAADVVTPKEEPTAPEGKYFGYHSSNVGPETITKEGIKANNPLADVDWDVPAKELRAAHGVYYHGVPHTEYGEHLYRISIPNGTPASSYLDREGDGENIRRSAPKSWVTYMGHGMEGHGSDLSGFHHTSEGYDTCPACKVEQIAAEEQHRQKLSKQFEGTGV